MGNKESNSKNIIISILILIVGALLGMIGLICYQRITNKESGTTNIIKKDNNEIKNETDNDGENAEKDNIQVSLTKGELENLVGKYYYNILGTTNTFKTGINDEMAMHLAIRNILYKGHINSCDSLYGNVSYAKDYGSGYYEIKTNNISGTCDGLTNVFAENDILNSFNELFSLETFNFIKNSFFAEVYPYEYRDENFIELETALGGTARPIPIYNVDTYEIVNNKLIVYINYVDFYFNDGSHITNSGIVYNEKISTDDMINKVKDNNSNDIINYQMTFKINNGFKLEKIEEVK